MGTVAVLAACRIRKDFLEVVAHLLVFHVEGAESFDARGVNQVAVPLHLEHLREGGGVHAFVVGRRDFSGLQVLVWQDGVDEGGLAHAGIARKERHLSLQGFLDGGDSLCMKGRHRIAGIADVRVEVHQPVQVPAFVVRIEVGLVEDQADGYAVGFGRGQEAVDEDGGGLRIVDGHDEQALVEVGGDDVRLLREVRRASDDVVLPVVYFGDERRPLRVGADAHPVAHGHGVGAADSFQAEVALDLAFHQAAVVRLDDVPAAGVLYY